MIGARSNIRRGALASAFLLAVAACDFDVSNPGPVEDRILNDPTSHAAVVNGIARAVSDATNNHTLQTAAATRELHASGNTGTISVQIGQGLFQPEEGGLWSSAQRARWIGDDAVRRLTDVGATDATLDALYDAGTILRTHVLRPTWHFVLPADLRWLVALTGPRILAASKGMHKRLGLTAKVLDRAHRAA